MAITDAAYAEAQAEIERLRTAVENQRKECDCAWREVDFIAKERNEHLSWRTALADKLHAIETFQAALRKDAERYRWLRGEADISGERWMRWNLQRWDGRGWHSLELTALDAAVDAAMNGKK